MSERNDGNTYVIKYKENGIINVIKTTKYDEKNNINEILDRIKFVSLLNSQYIAKMDSELNSNEKIITFKLLKYEFCLCTMVVNDLNQNGKINGLINDTCVGLKILHENNIIHGNIKPQNIFYYEDHWLLSDYDRNSLIDIKSTPFTTYPFMSPEMIKNEEYDEKTDLWSLGCLIYYCIYENSPFFNHDILKIKEKILDNKIIYNKDIKINEIIKKLLVTEKDKRMNIDEVIDFFNKDETLQVNNTESKIVNYDIFGKELINKDHDSYDTSIVLHDKIVMVYFSYIYKYIIEHHGVKVVRHFYHI